MGIPSGTRFGRVVADQHRVELDGGVEALTKL